MDGPPGLRPSMLRAVVGDPASTPLRTQILHLLMVTAAGAGLFFLLSDAVLRFAWPNFVYDTGMTAVFWGLYWWSRRHGGSVPVSHLAAAAGIVFCLYNYFVNAGLSGPSLTVFLMILVFVVIIHRPGSAALYVGFGALAMAACVVTEYLRPDLISPYPSDLSRYLDMGVTTLFCVAVVYFVVRLVMEFFDETLQRSLQIQQAADHAEKMAALGELLASVSHEINTPIGVIGSSLGHARTWWGTEMGQAPRILGGLTPAQTAAFWLVLDEGLKVPEAAALDSRTRRNRRAVLGARLESLGWDDPLGLAEAMTELDLLEWNPRWEALMTSTQGREAFQFMLRALTLDRFNRTALAAYGKIVRLTEALGAYSRSENPDEAPVPLRVIDGLDTVLTLYATGRHQNIEVIRQVDEVPRIVGRPEALIQVWTNLVKNALQALGPSGTLTVSVGSDDEAVVVTVADTGPGVPPELRGKIFDAFFTTKERGQGTGLGLAIVKRIVTAHGGQVRVEDGPAGGARFVVRLPYVVKD